MPHRHPTLYCKVCDKLVVMNIHGTVTAHFAQGDTKKQVICAGSEQPGTLNPSFDQLLRGEVVLNLEEVEDTYNPRHARRMPRELGRAVSYIFALLMSEIRNKEKN